MQTFLQHETFPAPSATPPSTQEMNDRCASLLSRFTQQSPPEQQHHYDHPPPSCPVEETSSSTETTTSISDFMTMTTSTTGTWTSEQQKADRSQSDHPVIVSAQHVYQQQRILKSDIPLPSFGVIDSVAIPAARLPPSSITATAAATATATTIATPAATATNIPATDDAYRAVHRVRLSALDHNFACVESAANRQRCSVIVVVKADGYGHGAIATALHLADVCGCDAFAVATLEEGIALRKAFVNNPPGQWCKNLASQFHTQDVGVVGGGDVGPMHNSRPPPPQPYQQPQQQQGIPSVVSVNVSTTMQAATRQSTNTCPVNTNAVPSSASSIRTPSVMSSSAITAARTMRPTKIRILVLGPPVGFPRCFDDYFHHDIEVMVSGPEVAKALMHWVGDEKERRRAQAERVAAQYKAEALAAPPAPAPAPLHAPNNGEEVSNYGGGGGRHSRKPSNMGLPAFSTLSAVQGQDLVKELRSMLLNQSKAAASEAAQQQANANAAAAPRSAVVSGIPSAASSVSSDEQQRLNNGQRAAPPQPKVIQTFNGIEAAAKLSRQRQIASDRASVISRENSSTGSLASIPGTVTPSVATVTPNRKLLRWHALVDSGMGRLGFRTEEVAEGEDRIDTVDVLKEMVDAEIHRNAPIEFYGMCTHMAEANDTSDYTHKQIKKFVSLLKRVRAAKIFVPTVSTDNSAALLTTSLNHFDPKAILSQSHSDTRGYVRTGGAIYGQRPAFKQLKAVSTLTASVRHVAVLKKGESVGYDRAYSAPYDVRIATIAIGFADGYPRELGNGVGKVAIRGACFPVAGNVCMDMMMVELGPAEDKTGVGAMVSVGDTAVLWGPLHDGEGEGLVRLQDIAATLKTTQSALTCGLDKIRVRRQFV